MKKIFSLFSLLLIILTANAQYGTTSEKFIIKTRHLPRYYVPANERNYSLVCAADNQVQRHVRFSKIDDELVFDGWNRSENNQTAYIKINLELKSLIFEGFGVKENIIETRDREGHPIKVTTFQGIVNYSMVNTWNIKTPTEVYYSNIDESHAPKSFIPEREYDNPAQAMEYVKNNREVFKDQIINDEVMKCVYEIEDIINQNYVYYPYEEAYSLEFLYNKKNEYSSTQRLMPDRMRALFSNITPQGGLATTELAMEDVFKHFQKVADAYSFSDKKQKNAKYAMIYNLVILNTIFENFTEAKRLCQVLTDSNVKKMYTRDIYDKIINKENAFIKHHLTTQHF
ncbi:MAG: hypothetical protein MJ211_06865 [Bacteroidales bacterium]|nr:hypothetical protein [Bacteroidales bacterium]